MIQHTSHQVDISCVNKCNVMGTVLPGTEFVYKILKSCVSPRLRRQALCLDYLKQFSDNQFTQVAVCHYCVVIHLQW